MIERGKTYEGGCLCGAVRYRLKGPSVAEQHCCCTDCQKATGTGHATLVCVHKSQLTVLGDLSVFTVQGASGGDTNRHFCARCGGRIYSTATKAGEMWIVQAGTLDDPDVVEPTAAIYASQATAWDHFPPAMPLYDTMGPPSAEALAAVRGEPVYLQE